MPTLTAHHGDRDTVIQAYARGNVHAFVDSAFRILTEIEEDADLVVLLVRALCDLGLGGPARELLQSRPESRIRANEFAAMRALILDIPTGRVSWEEFRAQFEANAASLTQHHDAGTSPAQLLDSLKSVQLYRDKVGVLQLSRRLGSVARVPRQWIGGFRAPLDLLAVQLPGSQPHLHVPLILGLGMNALVERVLKLTAPERGRPHRPVFVIEPQVEVFAAWLHVENHADALSQERVHWFVGEDAVARFEAAVIDVPNLGPHTVHLFGRSVGALAEQMKPILPRVAAHRTRLMERTRDVLTTRSAHRNGAYWADRLKPGATIVGFTSRHSTMLQYSMRDIGAALTQLGYDFRLELEPAVDRPHTPLTVSRRIEELDPALVLLLNNLRHDLGKSDSTVPTLTWVQDPVPEILNRESPAKLGAWDFLCGYYQKRCTTELGYDSSKYFSIPFFPVNEQVFHAEPLDAEQHARFGCDVAYVGHYHGTPEEWRTFAASRYPGHLHSLLDVLFRVVHDMFERGQRITIDAAPGLVEREAQALNLSLSATGAQDIGSFYVYRLFDIHYRLQTLDWAARWARQSGRMFHIYGRDWSRHPSLREFAHGEVAHGEGLRQAYRGATLVIQSVPSGMNHQRTYEALVSGSLVVGRYSPADFADMPVREFTRLHGDGSALKQSMYYFGFRNLQPITFESESGFAECVNELLGDPPAREALLHKYQQVVLCRLTYSGVVSRLMDWLREALKASP